MKTDTRPGPQAKYSKHVSPAVGDFAIQECAKVRAENTRLLAEREQLVAALRIARAALVREGHHPQHSGILIETIDPLLARLGAE